MQAIQVHFLLGDRHFADITDIEHCDKATIGPALYLEINAIAILPVVYNATCQRILLLRKSQRQAGVALHIIRGLQRVHKQRQFLFRFRHHIQRFQQLDHDGAISDFAASQFLEMHHVFGVRKRGAEFAGILGKQKGTTSMPYTVFLESEFPWGPAQKIGGSQD